ncbi:MAG: hypothetical protein HYW89_00765 [Candidatus Sungiibacteriota bacterium]|uniref:2-dehydro-3-deoxyphosphogluconate aldolase n=1 Tax=Candidatus Sungiibacteriota bacterium TaxID=2750080 RepID=A0A7T5URF0_9BACT|nr:MAG: hypothetical protein HYW89_00765 [Candidatus Sungbacteria bacterium]
MTSWPERVAVLERLTKVGVLPTVNVETTVGNYVEIARALLEGGIPAMEILYRPVLSEIPIGRFEAIREIRRALAGTRFLIGCGTLQTAEDVSLAHAYGAQFVVSNAAAIEVVKAANTKGILVMPAAETQEEVRSLLPYNPLAIKLFMPSPLDVRDSTLRLQQFRGCFPRTGFAVTGGINLDNAAWFLQEGYLFVISGGMVKQDVVSRNAWKEISEAAEHFAAQVSVARKKG